MATKPMDGLLGSKDKYKVNKEAKRYTLKDHGFIEGKNGAFQYERTLSRSVSDSTAPKLKITICKKQLIFALQLISKMHLRLASSI